MKTKITFSMLSAIIAVAMMPVIVNSQNPFSGVRSMGSGFNSAGQDQGGAITPNGLSYYFSRSTGPGSPNDIWVSQRATLSSPWGGPGPLGATINSSSNEVVPSFSRDGLQMFFTSDRASGFGLNDIYLSTRANANDDFGWTAPVNLGPVINTIYSERGPTYFEDPVTGSKTLIFAREPVIPPAAPFHDLYQSTRNTDGTFNAPTPISELNSVGSEIRAMFRSDGLEVFIHTSRAGGLSPPPPAAATFDIFVSTRSSTASPWTTPVIVPGLNTAFTEGGPALSPDGTILYFQSDRPGGLGGNDLYSATRCSLYSAETCIVNRNATADFDGDLRADISIFRPLDGTWWIFQSSSNTVAVHRYGTSGDTVVPGDYDSDGRTDLALFRPSDQNWWISRSSDGLTSRTQFGIAADKPTPGDYDGDGRTDNAIYRNGTWRIRQSSNGQDAAQQFGLSSDVPVALANGQ